MPEPTAYVLPDALSTHRVIRIVLTGALLALALAAPAAAAAAAATVTTVRGAPGPGPARYDRVQVERFGPADARTVLVLVPGLQGGAGDFALIAPEIAARVPGLAVWALDRRTYALEDHAGFASGDPDAAFRYYLGGGGFRPPSSATLGFARRWGLSLALRDLRRVVRRAGAGGRRVILGGHSLGASTAVAYAAWDFGGRAGHRDLDGLVLIDGGLNGTFAHPSLAAIRARLAALRHGDPFLDLLGAGVPWAAGVFTGVGGAYAAAAPAAPSPLRDFPLLPAALRPPVPVTNAALLGYAFDRETNPAALASLRINAGGLAPAGDVRGWVDGGVTPIARLIAFAGRQPVDGVEWYFPSRLTLDVDAASPVRRTRAGDLLGLRLRHARGIALPLYAFQTDLTGGRVLRGARRLMATSRIRRATLVDAAREQSHLDPLLAAPRGNAFLRTVVPYLRARTRR